MKNSYVSPYNYLTVKVDSLMEDRIKSTSLDLKIRTDIRPTHHTKIYGEVIGLPRAFRDDVMPDGDILWHSEGIEDFYKIGDKVYFHYNCVLDKAKQIEDNVFFIPARRIYLKVQSDNIIMSPGFSLGDKIYDDNVVEIELDGKRTMAEVSEETGIVIDIFPKPIEKNLLIKHTSNNKKNDRVLMLDDSNMEIEVEDQTYYLLENRDIVGTYG
jgi:co-chaperonin GroES (HSP10)